MNSTNHGLAYNRAINNDAAGRPEPLERVVEPHGLRSESQRALDEFRD
jgi:hypothetical protein